MAGIRDHDVDRPHIAVETAEHHGDLRWIADVRFENERAMAELAHAPGGFFRAVSVCSVVDPDVRSGRREGNGDALADAAAGAGDKRILPFEPDLHGDPFSSPGKPVSRRPRVAERLPAGDPLNARGVARDSA